jgi:hypothetical protein
MDILAECHNQDRRKTYHALTFADQAIQYWNVYADETAHKYLETAYKWLTEEQRNVPWNRQIRRLAKEVQAKLEL